MMESEQEQTGSLPSLSSQSVHLLDELRSMEQHDSLTLTFKKLPSDFLFPCLIGNMDSVAKKNRFKNVVPYDHNRVTLTQIDDVKMTSVNDADDYINASYIRGTWSGGYIATQGPMPGTSEDFWRMVWSEDSRIIVMMSRLVEQCQIQSCKYWADVGDCIDVDDVVISTHLEEERATYAIRKFSLSHRKSGEIREVTQLQFLYWPCDRPLPSVPVVVHFLKLFQSMRSSGAGPPIIHCSNGAERTGLFIALDSLCGHPDAPLSSVDMFNCAGRLREDRNNFISSKDEYSFIFKAVSEFEASRNSLHPFQDTPVEGDGAIAHTCAEGGCHLERARSEWQTLKDQIHKLSKVACPEQVCVQPPPDDNDALDSGYCVTTRLEADSTEQRLTAVCLPLNWRCTRRLRELQAPRLRHSMSLHENELMLGLSGVLPPEGKMSFLVTKEPDKSQTEGFWQLLFDAGCRTVVAVNLPHNPPTLEFPVHTSDFCISVDSKRLLHHDVEEITLSLKAAIENTLPLDDDVPPEQFLKMFTFPWSHDNHVTSNTSFFLLFKIINKWLAQTSTSLIAVMSQDDCSSSGQFCASFNALSSVRADQSADLYLTARTVEEHLPGSLSQRSYENMFSLCDQYAIKRTRHTSRLSSDDYCVSLFGKAELDRMNSSTSTDD